MSRSRHPTQPPDPALGRGDRVDRGWCGRVHPAGDAPELSSCDYSQRHAPTERQDPRGVRQGVGDGARRCDRVCAAEGTYRATRFHVCEVDGCCEKPVNR